ncbi:MAG: gamma-glutamyl-gamma-aminobutyrate hydrolase family protein [Planctomycetota bacterium]
MTLDHDRSRDRYQLSYACVEAVRQAGGEPVLLPFHDGLELPSFVQGMVFSGGNDPDPAAWGEEWHPACNHVDPKRERHERALVTEAERRGMPALGICFGMQVMNLVRGGSLIQHLGDLGRAELHARQPEGWSKRHDVALRPESLLAKTCGVVALAVNTSHHQSVGRVGEGLVASAVAQDTTVEAIEDPTKPFWLGVQWHPERQSIEGESRQAALFEALVRAAS